MDLGPFDVSASQVTTLGSGFTVFVNRLLDTEADGHQLRGHHLVLNDVETIRDRGVDAGIRGAPDGSAWIPQGDSAWQFKRYKLGPKGCGEELRGATWAHKYLREGGSYVLVLGVSLSDSLIEDRRKKLAEVAIELGLIDEDDRSRLRVYDAGALARWASQYPALAVSQIAGGPGNEAVDLERWSHSPWHQVQWVDEELRATYIETLRSKVCDDGLVEIRLEGESGVGKTRLVLHALDHDGLRNLVVYVRDVQRLSESLLVHLLQAGRQAILVVDECPGDKHLKLVESLTVDANIKLITIGDGGGISSRDPILKLGALPDPQAEEFLRRNYPSLGDEARRFVVTHCCGNVRWIDLVARRVTQGDSVQAAEIIRRDDIERFVADWLPEGRDFFFASLLALFQRVGWDRELRQQVELIAGFAGTDFDALDAVEMRLEQEGLITRQGRYRSINPHPLAIYLATEAWKTSGDRIVSELLPVLDEDMALSLFRRLADLGRFEPAISVLPRMLTGGGMFSSLDAIEEGANGRLLTQLAIVLPDRVSVHLGELIEGESIESLRARTGVRRDLVWTLEKLAWHSRTFERAAEALRRLALAENESYANNASATWVSLFGTMLPGTAALPTQRVEYLERVARDDSTSHQLVIQAAGRGISPVHDSIMVFGELQGGVLVEPRGRPSTWGEVRGYRKRLMAILVHLASNENCGTSSKASQALVEAVHPLLGDPVSGEDLLVALQSLVTPDQRFALWTEVEHLLVLYRRYETAGRELLVERLEQLRGLMPPLDPRSDLSRLLRLNRWDLAEEELATRILEVTQELLNADALEGSLAELSGERLPAAWDLGRAIGKLEAGRFEWAPRMLGYFSSNPDALIGYLQGRVESGDAEAFDDFLDSVDAGRLSDCEVAAIATRGPVTQRSSARVLGVVPRLTVLGAIQALYGWWRNVGQADAADLLSRWIDAISTDTEYAAVVGWVSMRLRLEEPIPTELSDLVLRLLQLRSSHPGLPQNAWDWNQLALKFVGDHARALAALILELIDSRSVMVVESDYDSQLLVACARLDPEGCWGEVAPRLLAGSWIILLEIRRWFVQSLPPSVVIDWVGADLERARIAAELASVGREHSSELAAYLLTHFEGDDQIESSLWGDVVSGSWTGPESIRLSKQIAQFNGWRENPDEPLAVRRWAGKMIDNLESRKATAEEREAEQGF
jgi:hypothetical protein